MDQAAKDVNAFVTPAGSAVAVAIGVGTGTSRPIPR
jgi:hypothetical protein